jgi:hypothetical protein
MKMQMVGKQIDFDLKLQIEIAIQLELTLCYNLIKRLSERILIIENLTDRLKGEMKNE